MLDPRPEDAGLEVVPHLSFITGMEFLTEKGCDVLRLHGMYCGADERFIHVLEIRLPVKEDVGCVLGLHDGPLIGKTVPKGAITLREEVEGVMEVLRSDVVGKLLSLGEVFEREEGVFPDDEGDGPLLQSCCKPVVAVAVELEPEGTPGGDAEIAEAKLLVDEVEVVVEALAGIVLEEGVSRRLVVPWPVARAG